jgi:hypothetical protein
MLAAPLTPAGQFVVGAAAAVGTDALLTRMEMSLEKILGYPE